MLAVPSQILAYFGSPGGDGAAGLAPVHGVGMQGNFTNHTVPIVTAGVFQPVEGTWSGVGLDFTLSTAGLFTYTGAGPAISTIYSYGSFHPITVLLGPQELRLGLSFDGAAVGSPGQARIATRAVEFPQFMGLLYRFRISPGGTVQLMIANQTSDDDVQITLAGMVVA